MIFLDVSCMCIVYFSLLIHWGRVTHIRVGKLTIVGSDNGLSPERRQAIIWTNAGILLTGPLGTNLSEILIEIQTFWLKKIRLKMSSAKCCSFRLGLNVLIPSINMSTSWMGIANESNYHTTTNYRKLIDLRFPRRNRNRENFFFRINWL